ncbi:MULTISPECIES: sensor histidine kinase [Flavobacteriaceae]|uniref:sensor histidine kinase n=1 Tax=Flavobacteriaceae TaxID=49546 RepID=UPI001490CF48|nr:MULTISPECIES: histidine kinase [Allomuricauda]MDC6366688.1 histidine kinase [Muricauda sp. AC10]
MLKRVFQSYKKLPISIGKIGMAFAITCLFFMAKEYTDYLVNQYNFQFSWFYIGIRIVLNYSIWFLMLPLAHVLVRRLQVQTRTLLQIILFVVSILLIAVVHNLISGRLYDVVFFFSTGYMKDFFGQNNIIGLVVGSFSSLIELLVIMAIFFGIDYQRRYLKNQKELIAAQLSSLQMQLHPHFLFNTLHSISSMIDIDSKMAQKMLTKIGDLMRTMLENDLEQMITIEQELDFIEGYLELEQIRYSDKMVVNYNVAKAILKEKIPNMLLQPIVENVIKFGVASAIDKCIIDVRISRQKDGDKSNFLAFEVSNTAENREVSEKAKGTGVGLKNIKKRLEGYYGPQYFFSSSYKTDNLYVTKICLPINS